MKYLIDYWIYIFIVIMKIIWPYQKIISRLLSLWDHLKKILVFKFIDNLLCNWKHISLIVLKFFINH